jgi:hypothetical protein
VVAVFLVQVTIRLRPDDEDAWRVASWLGLLTGFVAGGRIVPIDSSAFYPFVAASIIAFGFAGFLAWRYRRRPPE